MLVLAVQNSRISHKIKKMIKLSIEFRNSEVHCFFGHPQAARINRRLRCNSNLTFAHVPSIIQLKLLLCLYWCENRYSSWSRWTSRGTLFDQYSIGWCLKTSQATPLVNRGAYAYPRPILFLQKQKRFFRDNCPKHQVHVWEQNRTGAPC